MSRGGMQHVDLDEAVVAVEPVDPDRRSYRWWLAGVVGVAVLALVAFQLAWDARERAQASALAAIPGVLAPVDPGLPVQWRRDASVAALVLHGTVVGDTVVGPVVEADGSQRLVALDLGTGTVRWSTELLGPDPTRAASARSHDVSQPTCAPTTGGRAPARVACLVSDGFTAHGTEPVVVPATTTYVSVVDTSDGRVVEHWPSTGAALAMIDGLAVVAVRDGNVLALDAHDPLSGARRWHVDLAETAGGASVGWPPSIRAVGGDVGYSGTDGSLALLDSSGARVHPEIDGRGSDAGMFEVEPVSGTLLFRRWDASTVILPGDGSTHTVPGDLDLPTVDDGSVPGLVLTTVTVPAADGPGKSVLHAVDVATGRGRWETRSAVQPRGTVILRGKVFVSSAAGLRAFDGSSGRALWSHDPGDGTADLTTTTDGRYLLVAEHRPTGGGDVVALDPSDGHQVWRTSLPADADQVTAIGPALLGVRLGEDGRAQGVMRLG